MSQPASWCVHFVYHLVTNHSASGHQLVSCTQKKGFRPIYTYISKNTHVYIHQDPSTGGAHLEGVLHCMVCRIQKSSGTRHDTKKISCVVPIIFKILYYRKKFFKKKYQELQLNYNKTQVFGYGLRQVGQKILIASHQYCSEKY